VIYKIEYKQKKPSLLFLLFGTMFSEGTVTLIETYDNTNCNPMESNDKTA
jgi:hypothetical protein